MSALTLAHLGELSTADWIWLAAQKLGPVLFYPALTIVAFVALAWLLPRFLAAPRALREAH